MFKALFTLSLFTVAVFGQGVVIVEPTKGQVVKAGSNLTIQVERTAFPVGSVEGFLVLGLESCPSQPCLPPSNSIGTILYNGVYRPEAHDPYLKVASESFSVQVPSSTPSGNASITALHVSLIGPSHTPSIETLNQSIIIE